MSKGNDQLAALVAPILDADERHLATGRVSYNGTVLANSLTIDASIASIDHGAAEIVTDREIGPDVTAFFPTANQMAIALTDQRLFLWSLGFSGKPKQFIGSVPLTAIAAVRTEAGSVGTVLHVTMRSGAIITLEFMKGEPADEFLVPLVSMVHPDLPVEQ